MCERMREELQKKKKKPVLGEKMGRERMECKEGEQHMSAIKNVFLQEWKTCQMKKKRRQQMNRLRETKQVSNVFLVNNRSEEDLSLAELPNCSYWTYCTLAIVGM